MRHIELQVSGNPYQWCAMGGATELISARWHFGTTLRAESVAPFSLCAIPASLQQLELLLTVPLGNLMVRSLAASIPNARGLTTLSLDGVGVPDFQAIVNALAFRATDNFSIPLHTLSVRLSALRSTPRQTSIDVAGLRHLTALSVRVDAHVTPQESSDAQQIVDAIVATNTAQLITFEYWGRPLQAVDAWVNMVHRSSSTLTQLVVPPFAAGLPITMAEMAVDAASCLERLVIAWQAMRLDFMLCNKPKLNHLHHWGAVFHWPQLIGQLTATTKMQSFLLSTQMPHDFVMAMADSVRWPDCEVLEIAGIDNGILAQTREAVRHGVPIVDP